MTYQRIKINIKERIATLTLSDPERMNAMSPVMREECMRALRALEEESEADCVIITGSGQRAFSAGADIDELATRNPQRELASKAQLRRALPLLLETLRLPSVAAINGYCLGAGLELAMACTLRFAAESARLGLPEINLGVIPGSGGTQRLGRLVGMGRAMEMVTLGEPIAALEALRIGLVNRVHADGELMAAARAVCEKWKAKGPVSLMAARDAVLRAPDLDLTAGIEYEKRLFALCLASGERDEGVTAFREKREGRFRAQR